MTRLHLSEWRRNGLHENFSTFLLVAFRPRVEYLPGRLPRFVFVSLAGNGCLPWLLATTNSLAKRGNNKQYGWYQRRAFPTIAANALAINKKKTISKFIQDETDILIVEVAEELLKGRFMEAIEECYIKELCQGYSEYDNRSLFELIDHT